MERAKRIKNNSEAVRITRQTEAAVGAANRADEAGVARLTKVAEVAGNAAITTVATTPAIMVEIANRKSKTVEEMPVTAAIKRPMASHKRPKRVRLINHVIEAEAAEVEAINRPMTPNQ